MDLQVEGSGISSASKKSSRWWRLLGLRDLRFPGGVVPRFGSMEK